MRYEMISSETFPVLEVTLARGEQFVAESGAMSWMSPQIDMKTSTRGGMLTGLKRKMLGGESLFQNTFSTKAAEATVGIVPGKPGTLVQIEMAGRELFLEKGAYVASTPGVVLDTKFGGLKGLFNEGLFVLKASGTGTMFFSGYGAVTTVEVNGEYIVDNGYAVAWDGSLDYSITKAKKIRSFLFGDQLLLKFRGRGVVWVQSRSGVSLANFIYPFRRVKRKG